MAPNDNIDNTNDDFNNVLNKNLNKFFIKDVYVTLTSYKLIRPLTAVVVEYSNNILSVRFKNSDLTSNLMEGDPIVISLSHENMLYNASSSVLVAYSSTMDLNIEKVVTKNDLRKDKRFLVSFSGNAVYNTDTSFIIVKNISLNGLYFLSKSDLPLSTEIAITVNTYDFMKIQFMAKIVHKTSIIDNYFYGVSITNIDNINREKLTTCINSL